MYTKELTLYGVKLNITYKVEGKHYPATRETPEEFPDIVMEKITASDSDIDLTELLDHNIETIYNKLIELV